MVGPLIQYVWHPYKKKFGQGHARARRMPRGNQGRDQGEAADAIKPPGIRGEAWNQFLTSTFTRSPPLTLDFRPPALWDNTFLLFRPSGLCCFVTAVPADSRGPSHAKFMCERPEVEGVLTWWLFLALWLWTQGHLWGVRAGGGMGCLETRGEDVA